MALSENLKKPPPRWFRLTKKISAITINTAMTALLLLGYGAESMTLLIIKLAESYLMNLLDSILASDETYSPPYSAPNDTTAT